MTYVVSQLTALRVRKRRRGGGTGALFGNTHAAVPNVCQVRDMSSLLYTTVYIYTPLGRFSDLDCSTSERVLIPNDTSSASSPRAVFNADLVGTGTIPTVEISTMANRPRGV